MKNLFILLFIVFIGCKEDLEQVDLEVDVSSGISYVSLEGHEVLLYGPESTLISTIDANGKAYFDFEAPLGGTYIVEFQTHHQNFNPQGVVATDWSPVLVNDKLKDDITVGEDSEIELLVIPSSGITINVHNQINEAEDSLYLVIKHELYSTEIQLDDSRSGSIYSYSGPMGHYEYEGTSFKANDTVRISGSFEVPHNVNFDYEILY